MACSLPHPTASYMPCSPAATCHDAAVRPQQQEDNGGEGIEVMAVETSPQSPVSVMAAGTLDHMVVVLEQAKIYSGDYYKEVIDSDSYYSPRQGWSHDPYERDRLRRDDRWKQLSLESIFDKHYDDDMDMEFSDDDDDDDPRGLSFIMDDCSSSVNMLAGMDCSSIGWSSVSSTLGMEDAKAEEHTAVSTKAPQ